MKQGNTVRTWARIALGATCFAVASNASAQTIGLDVVSRAVSFNAGGTLQLDVVSRAVSFNVGNVQQTDVVSRAVSFNAGGALQLDVVSRAVAFNAPEAGPDLVVDASASVIPTDGLVNQPFEIRWVIRNQGALSATGSWSDEVRFSRPIQPASGGPSATAFVVTAPGNLAAQATYELVATFLMPQTETPFTVLVTTDLNGQLAETIEGNNTLGPRTITPRWPKPNLQARIDGAPTGQLFVGATTAASFTIWNSGEAPTSTPTWSDRLYLRGLGTSTVFELLGSYPNQHFLPNDPGGAGSTPGTYYSWVAQPIQIPANIPGGEYYRLEIHADASHSVSESNENDNVGNSGQFFIQAAPRPDLLVTSVALTELQQPPPVLDLQAGLVVNAYWRVENRVDAQVQYPGGNVWTELWLCPNSSTSGPDVRNGRLLARFNANLPPILPGAGLDRSRSVQIPPDITLTHPEPNREYHLKVFVDSEDQVPEAELAGAAPYWNNLGLRGPFRIDIGPTPDLRAVGVEILPGATVPQLGQPIQVRWQVGVPLAFPSPVPVSWRDEVWLSTDATWQPSDLRLGEFLESATPTGSTWSIAGYDKTVSLPLSANLAAGNYFVIVRVDARDDVFEYADIVGTPDNEAHTVSSVFLDRRPADLDIQAGVGGGLIVPSTQGAPGQTITLPWTVTNLSALGVTSASSWTDCVYLSTSPLGHAGAPTVLCRTHSGALLPGASYAENRTAVVPAVPPGAYWLHFVTDANDVVFEGGADSNNFDPVPFQVTASVPDLALESLTATATASAGELISAQWTVRNVGVATTPVSSWVDSLYLSLQPDPPDVSSLVHLGSWPRSAPLGSGSAYSVSATFAIPIGLTPGDWYVVARTDDSVTAFGAVFESLESNNQRSTVTQIALGPPGSGGGGGGGGGGTSGQGWLPSNLVTSNVRAQSSPVTAGQAVGVAWDVTNTGLAPTDSGTWSDRVYLSIDANLDATDVALGYFTHSVGLAPAAVSSVAWSGTVPLWASGPWFLIVDADAQGDVYQTALADDVSASAVPLLIAAPPLRDLDIPSTSVPGSALLGQTLSFTWTTRNDSASVIPADWNWTDGFWLVPDGVSFPSAQSRFLGQIPSTAGTLRGGGMGTHTQSSPDASSQLDLPGVMPGMYRLVAVADVLGQIAETDEDDNVHLSTPIRLDAIPIAVDGLAPAQLPTGQSAWFELTAPADLTIDLEFEHLDPAAKCELYASRSVLPTLGTYDLAGQGLSAPDPHRQSIRIARTTGDRYFVLARTVAGAGATVGAQLRAISRPFAIADVQPRVAGQGTVTFSVQGSELWLAQSLRLRSSDGSQYRDPVETRHVGERFLARFELGDAPVGGWTPILVPTSGQEDAWSQTILIQPPLPLSVRAELAGPQSIRRGESGTGFLRLRNDGNVDVPFAFAVLGHPHALGATTDVQRVRLESPDQPMELQGGDPQRDSLTILVEDLPPGVERAVRVVLDVGSQVTESGATIGLSARPLTAAALVQGPLAEYARSLRMSAAVDPSTPALFSALVQDPVGWDAAISAAIANGLIDLDQDSLYMADEALRGALHITRTVADGIATQLGAPLGVELPAAAIEAAARSAVCAPFASVTFECDTLFPVIPDGLTPLASVTVAGGANVPVAAASIDTPGPIDPDEKLPPLGDGPSGTVIASRPLEYTVYFENEAGAPAWASRVQITDALEPGFLSSSVRFQELRIGDTVVELPPNSVSYLGTVPHRLPDGRLANCQISALTSATTNTIRVTLLALDPLTGLPNSLADFGLLPPSAPGAQRQASGYVKFSVLPAPRSSLAPEPVESLSGEVLRNTTVIQFNAEPPLQTNTTANMLDDRSPASSLNLTSIQGTEVRLSWRARDVESLQTGDFPGTGVASYSLYSAPAAGGPWTAVVTNTIATRYTYTGVLGTTVAFKIEAMDRVGNHESKATADLVVQLPTDCNGNGISDEEDIQSGVLSDANQNGVADVCECIAEVYCVSTPYPGGIAASISATGSPSISGGNFGLSVTGAAPQSRGVFFFGSTAQQIPLGDGYLCITGDVVRLRPLMTDAVGSASTMLDLVGPPLGAGPGAVLPGSTRYFQFWYRNLQVPGGSGSDLSDALRVTFCE